MGQENLSLIRTRPAVGIWAARELIIHDSGQKKNPLSKKNPVWKELFGPEFCIGDGPWAMGRNMMVADVRNKKFPVRRHLNPKFPANLQTVTIWESGHSC